MLALVSLREGRRSSLGTLVWPAPEPPDEAWVTAGIDAAVGDVRGFEPAELPWWLDDELWLAELAGRVERHARSHHAEQARLVRRIEAWNAGAAEELVAACAQRLREIVVVALRAEGRGSEADVLEVARDIEAAAGALEADHGAGRLAALLRDVPFYARDAGGGPRGAATAAYVAAHAAAGGDKHASGYPARFAAERAWQARWLYDRLELTGVLTPTAV